MAKRGLTNLQKRDIFLAACLVTVVLQLALWQSCRPGSARVVVRAFTPLTEVVVHHDRGELELGRIPVNEERLETIPATRRILGHASTAVWITALRQDGTRVQSPVWQVEHGWVVIGSVWADRVEGEIRIP